MPERTYKEQEIIALKIIEGSLSTSDVKRGAISVTVDFLRKYDPRKHKIDIIIRDK